jgi:hypothetical protein
MLKLEELKKHAAVSGIDPAAPVRIVSTEAIGDDALTVYYNRPMKYFAKACANTGVSK